MRQITYSLSAHYKPGSLFIGFNLADLLLTMFLLSIGAPELNPIFASMGNIYVFAVAKLAMMGVIVLGLARFNQMHLLRWVNIGMGLIVTWNILAVVTWLM
ncbi:MAG: hypothetical protein JXA01_07765 [Dehalococcoidia bacterium]|nr:hypothetical protein [Dehalococcoidia bacterium]